MPDSEERKLLPAAAPLDVDEVCVMNAFAKGAFEPVHLEVGERRAITRMECLPRTRPKRATEDDDDMRKHPVFRQDVELGMPRRHMAQELSHRNLIGSLACRLR